MKPALQTLSHKLFLGLSLGIVAANLSAPNALAQNELKARPAASPEKSGDKPTKQSDQENSGPKSRVFLTNGDRLGGKTQSIDADGKFVFHSDSLRKAAEFPL